MPYKDVKIYSDGSHYIGIPNHKHPIKKSVSLVTKEGGNTDNENGLDFTNLELSTISPKDKFEEVYSKSLSLKKKDRKEFIKQELAPYFKDENKTQEFVDKNIDRKQTNSIVKKVRLMRKVRLQKWNYFCTFTYDSAKQTEESFQKQLKTCLRHLAHRKDWKYVGVWERAPKTQRLHFHGLFYIPDGTMPGKLGETRDYNTKSHKMQITYINSHFNERFGRNDFKTIDSERDVNNSLAYIMKYMEKSNEKIVYSRGLPTYFVSDILESDVACPYGIEDRKLLLFDNFNCIKDGEIIGEVSEEVISLMDKSN